MGRTGISHTRVEELEHEEQVQRAFMVEQEHPLRVLGEKPRKHDKSLPAETR